jgi:LPXTG-motif cell wall-anchored protein
MRKIVVTLVAVAAALLGPATAANAAGSYPPDNSVCQAGRATVNPGESVTITCVGHNPNATITVVVDGPDTVVIKQAATTTQTVQADATGTAQAQVTFDAVGTYTVEFDGPARDGSATVQVRGSANSGVVSDGGNENLPRTGSQNVAAQLWAGVGLLGLGAGMVALTVSRRRASGLA